MRRAGSRIRVTAQLIHAADGMHLWSHRYDREMTDVFAIQDKWLPIWDELRQFASGKAGDNRPKKYVLDMFPYPSGDLHMGHAEAYALGDVIARYWIQRGFNVMHPIGWDAFGLPAENAAIKRGENPQAWTYENIAVQKASMRRYACSFDWDRVLNTCDPEYYKWNQWFFLQMFDRGLAYRKASGVNWCPSCQTVLANEQVVQGLCERCDTQVTKKKLTQWYFKITDYADRLLDDMQQLEGKWPDKVLLMQRNWIGRSKGAQVSFDIEGRAEPVVVYTTRPDTLFGATFFVVAVDSDLAAELAAGTAAQSAFETYLEQVKSTSEMDRLATDRPKTGVFLQRYAINPVNGERLPIWASDYVLADYGTGAIMAVPAHDTRDFEFARQFDVPIVCVVRPTDTWLGEHGATAELRSPAGVVGVAEQLQDEGTRSDHVAGDPENRVVLLGRPVPQLIVTDVVECLHQKLGIGSEDPGQRRRRRRHVRAHRKSSQGCRRFRRTGGSEQRTPFGESGRCTGSAFGFHGVTAPVVWLNSARRRWRSRRCGAKAEKWRWC